MELVIILLMYIVGGILETAIPIIAGIIVYGGALILFVAAEFIKVIYCFFSVLFDLISRFFKFCVNKIKSKIREKKAEKRSAQTVRSKNTSETSNSDHDLSVDELLNMIDKIDHTQKTITDCMSVADSSDSSLVSIEENYDLMLDSYYTLVYFIAVSPDKYKKYTCSMNASLDNWFDVLQNAPEKITDAMLEVVKKFVDVFYSIDDIPGAKNDSYVYKLRQAYDDFLKTFDNFYNSL